MASVLDPAADATKEEEHDPHYEPVIRLTEQVEVKTMEEDEEPLFKLRAKLFRFETSDGQWKERGTGDVRLLQHKETKKVRLVMRRDKTLKVCANHIITADMRLQPNIGSDRSWVWKAAADYADNVPTSETLAIRFANAENANQFKEAFEHGQQTNIGLASGGAAPAAPAPEHSEEHAESAEKTEEHEEHEAAADAHGEEAAAPAAAEPETTEPETTTDEAEGEVKVEEPTEAAEVA